MAPPDLMEMLGDKLRNWRNERQRLQTELEAEKRPHREANDVDARIDRISQQLGTLRERIGRADPAIVREVVRAMVSKIECWFVQVPYGKKGRMRSDLRRGLIHLRPDLIVSRDVPSGRPLTTVKPARARPSANRSATRRP